MAELTPERETELERCRAFERNQWRIAEDCGMPQTEAEKVWGMVHLEMKFYCSDFMRGLSIASYAKAWIETKNTFNIDFAVLLCSRSGITPPPALAALVAQAAEARVNGLKRGTAAKIRKENARGYAFNLMSCLGAAGATREEAASKAARNLADLGGGNSFKASTLEHDYTETWRAIEADRKLIFAEQGNEALLAEWQSIRNLLPEADEELKGNRRN